MEKRREGDILYILMSLFVWEKKRFVLLFRMCTCPDIFLFFFFAGSYQLDARALDNKHNVREK